jgi:hypothetical protein
MAPRVIMVNGNSSKCIKRTNNVNSDNTINCTRNKSSIQSLTSIFTILCVQYIHG